MPISRAQTGKEVSKAPGSRKKVDTVKRGKRNGKK
jgi:hypothetical protein